MTTDPRHHIVILGGGFGGLYAAKSIHDKSLRVTLVDRRNYHLFQPLLYQVATGSLSPANIAAPLRAIFRRQPNIEVLMADVIDIDVAGRRLVLADGDIGYDTLIVAAGAGHSYFGHDEWQAVAPGLKSIEDATQIRRRVLSAFERAERETDPREEDHLADVRHRRRRSDWRRAGRRDRRDRSLHAEGQLPPHRSRERPHLARRRLGPRPAALRA